MFSKLLLVAVGALFFQPLVADKLPWDLEEAYFTSQDWGPYKKPPPDDDTDHRFLLRCNLGRWADNAKVKPISDHDHDSAYSQLRRWCDSGAVVQGGKQRTFVQGQAQAFICSWKGAGKQPCSSVELDFYSRMGNESGCRDAGVGWDANKPYWKKGWGVVHYSVNVANLGACNEWIKDVDDRVYPWLFDPAHGPAP